MPEDDAMDLVELIAAAIYDNVSELEKGTASEVIAALEAAGIPLRALASGEMVADIRISRVIRASFR